MSVVDELIATAERLEAEGDLVSAHAKLEVAAMVDTAGSVQWRLGRSFMLQGQLTQARATLRQAVETNPNSAEAHFILGFSYKDNGQLPEARAALERGLDLSEWPIARAILGDTDNWTIPSSALVSRSR